MRPEFLLPETVARQDGAGPAIALEESSKPLQLTLGITRSMAEESLDVSVWGSPDGEEWRQLAVFPQKFYCGTYSLVLELARQPDIRYLRTQWRMGSWRHGESAPLFEFYLFVREGPVRQFAGAA